MWRYSSLRGRMLIGAVACSMLAAAGTFAEATAPMAKPKTTQVADWPASQDALADKLLAALQKNDPSGLDSVRVTREEYISIIVPWTVDPGSAPRKVRDSAADMYWQLLNTKSKDYANVLLGQFGGKTIKKKSVSFSQPAKEYAGYRALGELRIEVEADGLPGLVRSGWVAEIDGHYKLIGLEWDD